jgi:hypothetical protein
VRCRRQRQERAHWLPSLGVVVEQDAEARRGVVDFDWEKLSHNGVLFLYLKESSSGSYLLDHKKVNFTKQSLHPLGTE